MIPAGRWWPAAAVVVIAVAARADELTPAGLERKRTLVLVRAEARVADPPPRAALELGLARGGSVLLRGSMSAPAGGVAKGSLSTTRLLLPGAYELVLLDGEEVRARCPLTVGSDEERGKSEESERRWLLENARVARGLAVSLERNARFQAGVGQKPEEAKRRLAPWFAGLHYQLRRARADLALFERRVVAPHGAAAVDAYRALLALIGQRASAWEAHLFAGQGEAPAPEPLVEAGAALATAGGPRWPSEAWVAGRLGEVPRWSEVKGGAAWASDGFTLQVPLGFVAVVPPPARPEGVRLYVHNHQRTIVTVAVSEDPELRELEALIELHGTQNWESHSGFSRPETQRLPEGGLLVRFEWDPAGAGAAADAQRTAMRGVQRVLFAPERGRTYVLEVAWATSQPEPPELQALLGSFALVEEK